MYLLSLYILEVPSRLAGSKTAYVYLRQTSPGGSLAH